MPDPAIDKAESFKAFSLWWRDQKEYWEAVPETMIARIFPQVSETGESRENEGENIDGETDNN